MIDGVYTKLMSYKILINWKFQNNDIRNVDEARYQSNNKYNAIGSHTKNYQL